MFLQLTAEATGQSLLAHQRAVAVPGQPVEVPVLVEAGAGSVTFALAVPDAGDAIELALRSPSGQLVRSSDATADGPVRFFPGPVGQALQVMAPESGNWTMEASAATIANGSFEAIAYADHPGVQLSAWTGADNLAYPAAAELHATPTFAGQNVVGAVVTGTVRRPDGSTAQVQLVDDGRAEHGDAIADDGIYGARFSDYRGDVTYVVELQVSNTGGRTYAGEALFADQPSNEQPVPPFVRRSSTTLVVSGVPETPTASVTHGPESLNFESEEQFVTLRIELGGRWSSADIDPRSVRISAVEGIRVTELYAEDLPPVVSDEDGDGALEMQLKFDRSRLQDLLRPGSPQVTLEGSVGGEASTAEWTPHFVDTGKVVR